MLYARNILALLFLVENALGQTAPPVVINPGPVGAGVGLSSPLVEFFGSKTPYEFWLTVAILISGIVFTLVSFSFLKNATKETYDSATRVVTIILVVIATMVLVTAGYNNEQIAPAFGLFGTIIGYILGRAGMAEGKIAPTTKSSATDSQADGKKETTKTSEQPVAQGQG